MTSYHAIVATGVAGNPHPRPHRVTGFPASRAILPYEGRAGMVTRY
ncbi:hypothetical protein GXY_02011 [Novacetimonas hansenii ATCC 23769]|uniref:Uncharacterized protein n=1 Tax=Novacetimonas hansenii ATCC 23769 TaxID=714995 RepID=D5QBA9_NOVHA|nr:hypothetical protein GXY_02011 [Novacetimonas hansenii ATCC 23769]